MTFEELLDGLGSESAAPGAGPAAAWACALAAALVEMVAGVVLARGAGRPEPEGRGVRPELEGRRARARELRGAALRLADEDQTAYRAVQNAAPADKRAALSAAADPPLAIAEAAVETARLAADSMRDATGPVRGEAATAALLASAAAAAAARLVEMNLAGAPEDPRAARARELAAEAAERGRSASGVPTDPA
jgi:formiminotetrahydrofolate cyclodeaminase